MKDKQIIIDGVNVSKWTDEEIRYNFEKHSPKAIRQIAFDLYKQLARKEQECEKLKTQILLLQTMEIEELKNYKQSLAEIKKIMKKYCRKCKKHKFYHFKLCYTCKYTDILQKISEC